MWLYKDQALCLHNAFAKHVEKGSGLENCGAAIMVCFQIWCKHLTELIGWYQ